MLQTDEILRDIDNLAEWCCTLPIYRFYLGDKVDDFYLDRSESFNEENKRPKGFNIENQLEPESVRLKNKRPFEKTIQDYEEENIELDMFPEKNIFENEYNEPANRKVPRKLNDLEPEPSEGNKPERMGHPDHLVEISGLNVVEGIHMTERDVIEVKEEMDIVDIQDTEKTDKYCEDSSPMSITIHSEGLDPVQMTLNRSRHKKRPQNC
jgi:hypothetical protein